MKTTPIVLAFLLSALAAPAIAAQAATPAAPQAPAASVAPKPEIFFRTPRDGAVVPRTFTVVFGLRNFGVAPAGVRIPNTGHFHILIDVDPPGPGVVIPADSLHRHYGGGQIETQLTLPPGRHTLRLVLADADHKVIGPELISRPIRVTVR